MSRKRQLALCMAVFAGMYVTFGFSVLFAEQQVYDLMDRINGFVPLGQAAGQAPPVAVWKYVALGLIWMFAILSVWSYQDPDRHKPLIQLMIYAKLIAGGVLVTHFLVAGGVAVFLLSGLSDLAMGVTAWFFLARAFPNANRHILMLKPL